MERKTERIREYMLYEKEISDLIVPVRSLRSSNPRPTASLRLSQRVKRARAAGEGNGYILCERYRIYESISKNI